MRLLFVSQWYPPEPETRIHHLAEDLVARGHSVQVLTGFPNYPGGELYPGYRLRPWLKEVVNGVEVIRVPLYPSHDRSVVRRSLNYLSFAASVVTLGAALVGKADLVWIFHPPLTAGLAGAALAAVKRAPVVLEIQAMWPETLAASGMVRSKGLETLVGCLASALYRSVTSSLKCNTAYSLSSS